MNGIPNRGRNQQAILSIMSDGKERSCAAIADAVGLGVRAVHESVAVLAQRGYLVQRRPPYYRITDTGRGQIRVNDY